MTTLEFPRALPTSRIKGQFFELEPQEAMAPEQGGRQVSVSLGETLWRASYSTTPSSEAEFDEWRAWLSSLRGSQKLFYGRDVRRGRYPRAYRKTGFAGMQRAGGAGAFDGTALFNTNAARDEVDMGLLPVAFELAVGDYFGMRWGGHSRSLHRCTTPANADVDGALHVSFEPPLPAVVPVATFSTVVNLDTPDCLMVVTKRDLDAEIKDRRVSFEAVQHLEA